MSDTAIKLDILTPMGAIRDGIEVPGVEVPGVLGEIGVLPRHEALLTALVPGVVRFREGATQVRLAVGAGFLEVKEAGLDRYLVYDPWRRASLRARSKHQPVSTARRVREHVPLLEVRCRYLRQYVVCTERLRGTPTKKRPALSGLADRTSQLAH